MQFIDGKRIARVFPRKTVASPDDSDAFFDGPPLWADYDEAHISVSWTYDMRRAEYLAKQWESHCAVKIGGPACGTRGEDFTPGMYLRRGYTITSRGCPNKCWFCSVWRRDGTTRELKINDGWNLLDDNILACGEQHIRSVFQMLKRQPRRARFTGGLEAKLLKPWHCELLAWLAPETMFFAYDTPDDYEPLVCAGKLLKEYRRPIGSCRCYVLCGFPKDSFSNADIRFRQAYSAGFIPMAMLWRNKDGQTDAEWRKFANAWGNAAQVASMLKSGTTPTFTRKTDETTETLFTQNPTGHAPARSAAEGR